MTGHADIYRLALNNHLEQARYARCSSAELLSLVRTGDKEGYTVLLNRHGPEVYRWCMFFLRNKNDSEDLYQEVFLTLWQKCHLVRDPDKLDGWLFRIVRNKALNKLRIRKSAVQLENLDSLTDYSNGNSDHLVNKEYIELVMLELGQLRQDYQEAILLTKVQGLTLQAAAERMGRPIGAVSTCINRGLEKLTQKLRKYHIELSLPALVVVFNEALAKTTTDLVERTVAKAVNPGILAYLHLMLMNRLVVVGLMMTGLLAGSALALAWTQNKEPEPVTEVTPLIAPVTVTIWNREHLVRNTIPRLIEELKPLVTKDGTVRLISLTESDGPIYHIELQLFNRSDIKSSTLSAGIRWHYNEITGGIRCETDLFCKGNWSHADIDHPVCIIVGEKRFYIPCKQFRACELILRDLKSNPPPLIHPSVRAEIESDPKCKTIRKLVGYWHDPKMPADRVHLLCILVCTRNRSGTNLMACQ